MIAFIPLCLYFANKVLYIVQRLLLLTVSNEIAIIHRFLYRTLTTDSCV